jgi:hypothetical protein
MKKNVLKRAALTAALAGRPDGRPRDIPGGAAGHGGFGGRNKGTGIGGCRAGGPGGRVCFS